MKAIGADVTPNGKQPTVRCTVLEVDWSVDAEPRLLEHFAITTPPDRELTQAVGDIARSIRTRCADLGIDAVWIWQADRSRASLNSVGPRTRLITEGAVIG